MRLSEIANGLFGINLCGLSLLVRDRTEFRSYLSKVLRLYRDQVETALPRKDPIAYLREEQGLSVPPGERLVLPPWGLGQGGTTAEEYVLLAGITRHLRPKTVFEIGTFDGFTASVFLLNTPPEATVYSLDLPPDYQSEGSTEAKGRIAFDAELIRRRQLASLVYELHLEGRFRQLLGNSLDFDPEPYRDTIELGFVDGAHDYEFVKNDTEKMAVMMRARGLVFWHDYGGSGRYRPLSRYLEDLGCKIPVSRVVGTTLAWCPASALQTLRGGH
jgi:predicted O-methyltransferase YrrM